MKYSLNLLKHFISINDSVENIADKITLKTVEVEEIIQRKIDKHIVIGKIMSAENHPDSDHMSVCQVDCGSKWKFQIVCGAANVQWAHYVVAALEWAFFKEVGIIITPRKLRGVDSNGMICSKSELWIPEDADKPRIWELDKDFDDITDADLWTPLTDKYPRLDSAVIDVDNKWLTNRPDLTGHFGMAVDLNAMYDDSQISYNWLTKYFDELKNTNILELINNKWATKTWLKIETDNVNSYILMEINNVTVRPWEMLSRLHMYDLWSKPISNWVDFSNLFMNITWQPVHFFDADKIKWSIIVRQAKDWEKFVDLFEKEHTLQSTDMVIADEEKVLALAWVVWWLDSGITDSTKNILVEIANFDPVCVRKTWVRLGLRTDAELRYEKNISPSFSQYVFIFFLDLLKYYSKDLWSYEIWGISHFTQSQRQILGVVEAGVPGKKLESLKTGLSFFQNIIPVDYIDLQNFIFWETVEWFEDTAKTILTRLWFGVNWEYVSVPFWRSPDDITIVQDIYEEVARIYWYEKIPNVAMKSEISLPKTSSLVKLSRAIEESFVRDFGFDQVETYPWVDKKSLEMFGADFDNLYWLKNPIDTDKPYLRDDIDYIMINYVTKNCKFFDDFRMFDLGRIWSKKYDIKNEKAKFANEFVWERLQFAGMYYQKTTKSWDEDLLLEAKWDIEKLFNTLGLTWEISYEKADRKAYHPKKQWNIVYGGKVVWFVGTIHPLILKNYKIPETANLVYVSLDLPTINEFLQNTDYVVEWYETLQDQIVWRDLCFVIDENVDYGTVLDVAKNVNGVSDLEVFDLYKGTNLPEWKKSIAFKIKIKWENMQTEEINAVMDKVIKKVEATWAKLRE